MPFVNFVAEIVHGITVLHGGAPNKNIGAALGSNISSCGSHHNPSSLTRNIPGKVVPSGMLSIHIDVAGLPAVTCPGSPG